MAFEIIENACNMDTCIKSFKEYLTTDMNRDEIFYLNAVSTFVMKFLLLIEEAKKQSLPSSPRIK